MSQSAGGEGMKGSGAGDDDNAGGEKKGKGITSQRDDDQSHEPAPFMTTTSDEDSDEDVQARRRSTLDCLASLEDSLPMKRGLSSHYSGKAKSFGNLTDLALDDPKDLEKKEHRVNKKRRLLIAHERFDDQSNKQGQRGSSAKVTATQFHQVNENEDDQEHDDKEEEKNDDN